jgi:ketosteroid isomerase-like protein
MKTADAQSVETWVRKYGAAWESRDPRAAAALFSKEAEYYWTPFDPPHRGHEDIMAAWAGAVAGQKDIRFTFEVIGVSGRKGFAHWNARFTAVPAGGPVELDGILSAEFDSEGLCRVFREWWHLKSG